MACTTTDPNDRLLLGLKGTMSEAELHVLRGRLRQGLLNEVHRGEVFLSAPTGYVRAANGGFEVDPDEQVQGVNLLVTSAKWHRAKERRSWRA